MNKKLENFYTVILPNKRLNFFIFGIILLGIISGAIFLTIVNETDKNIIFEKISLVINNINSNTFKNGLALKNSLIINFSFIIIMFIMGLSLIGIIVNVFLVYIRSFVLGFTISSIIYVYKIKGILLSLIYIFPSQLLNIFTTLLLGVYTLVVSKYLINLIINKKENRKHPYNKYLSIFIIISIISILSSLLESFLVPCLIKVFIKLFI